METDTAARTGEVDETERLISSQKVEGTAVYNHEGENLGTVDHLMIDKFSGQVAYAVMSFGGFLGIGSSYHPLPWNALNYDVNLGGYRVDVNRARLEAAPRYTASTTVCCSSSRARTRSTLTSMPANGGQPDGQDAPKGHRNRLFPFTRRSSKSANGLLNRAACGCASTRSSSPCRRV